MDLHSYITASYLGNTTIVSFHPFENDKILELYIVEILREYLTNPQINDILSSNDFKHGFKIERSTGRIELIQQTIKISDNWIGWLAGYKNEKLETIAVVEINDYTGEISPTDFVQKIKNQQSDDLETSKLVQVAVVSKESNVDLYKNVIEELKIRLKQK